jgi:hypothetical protein
MNDSLLIYCYPTYSRALHLDSKGTSVVLAPDEMLLCLARRHRVDVVNLSPFPSTIPLMRSKIVMKGPEEVNPLNYGYCWHMFRDPLAPEVRELKPILADCFPHTNILNPVGGLQNHFKHKYLPLLHAFGVGPAVIAKDKVPADVQWLPGEWAVSVSTCKRFIKVYDFNNGRGDYPDWEAKRDTIVEYLDASEDGNRSFFRVGYACGKLTPGWLYTQPDTALVQKTGTCVSKELHAVPERFHPRIIGAMQAMDINCAHLEGCYVNGEVKIFDVNAYPTSYGGTLAPISEAMARIISTTMRRGDPVH